MRLSFLVPLLGLALGPRPIVSNTITVAEVEEVTGATDAGDGDIGMWPGGFDVVDEPMALPPQTTTFGALARSSLRPTARAGGTSS